MDEKTRRQQILAAASSLFAEQGYQATQMADIARHLNIGHGTLYRYFNNKEDIFDGVLDHIVTAVVQALAENPPISDSLAEHRALLRRFSDTLYRSLSKTDMVRLFLQQGRCVSPATSEKVDNLLNNFADLTSEYIRNGQKKGFIRENLDPRPIAFAINAIILEGARHISNSDDHEAALSRWSTELSDLVLDGIATRREQ